MIADGIINERGDAVNSPRFQQIPHPPLSRNGLISALNRYVLAQSCQRIRPQLIAMHPDEFGILFGDGEENVTFGGIPVVSVAGDFWPEDRGTYWDRPHRWWAINGPSEIMRPVVQEFMRNCDGNRSI